jgi:hypothetical protein
MGTSTSGLTGTLMQKLTAECCLWLLWKNAICKHKFRERFWDGIQQPATVSPTESMGHILV